jgi:outer membrane protein OmpA-like peptidoglycan-associated protein/tetratricopeptide (TPR) repeat protein
MKKILPLLLIFFLAHYSNGQTNIKIKLANKKYNNFHYTEAIKLYEEILTVESSTEITEKLAHSYRKINDSKNAETWYAKVVENPKTNAENKLFYAQMLAMNGKYDEAKRWYEQYAKEAKKDRTRAEAFVKSYSAMSEFYKDSARYRVEIAPFNTDQADFSPMFFKEGVVFCSNRPIEEVTPVRQTFKWNETRFLDLYVAQNPDAADAKLLHKKINTRFHEGPVSFYGSFDSLVFTRNNFFKGKLGKSNDDIHKLKIYFANTKEGADNDWTNISEFPYNSDQYSCGHPALSPDNTTLYFTSDMPGGYGGTDLYMTVFRNGRWSKPRNLGPEINTRNNEMFPFISKENDLYFASNGHPGMGGLDVFVAQSVNGKYKKPQNLGAPINSSQDDFGLIFDDDTDEGYFTSHREGGVGDDDIYKFKVRRCKFIGVVINAKTNEIIKDAQVEVFENQNAVGFRPETALDSITFKFKTKLHSSYDLKAFKRGFKEGRSSLTEAELLACLTKGEDISDTIRILLEPEEQLLTSTSTGGTPTNTFTDPKTGKIYRFRDPNVKLVEITNVYYDFDKYNIRRDASQELERVVEVMTQFPTLMIELSSHTDSRANNYYNIRLAQRRSSAAYHYLVRQGIDPARIRVNSFGENKLIVDCPDFKDCSEEEHQLNRRTEIIILSY